MSSSAITVDERVRSITFGADALSVFLVDGRVISVPLVWYPPLLKATPSQRANWAIAAGGYGIHWPDVAVYLSTERLLCKIDTERSGRLAGIHIAEYDALTTRITYYVTLQYTTWVIAAGLFGYLAPLWTTASSHRSLEWISLICLLAVSWLILHINYEMFLIVHYLMKVLLKSMATESCVRLDEVLGFEAWIRRLRCWEEFHRNHASPIMLVLGVAVLLVLLFKDIVCGDWTFSDSGWSVICVSLAAVVGVKVWRSYVLNKQIQELLLRDSTE